ncbi:MAG: sulfotransferase [Planctomycetia bacterium]|nr:sulfotransferase [Planctomycetia bacterium]
MLTHADALRHGQEGLRSPPAALSTIPVAYLVGTSYSGSTLLSFLVDMNPDVASVGEVALTPKSRRMGVDRYPCSCGRALVACPFWNQVVNSVQERGIPLSFDNWLHDYRYMHPIANRVLSVYSDRPWIQHLHRFMRSTLPVHRRKVQRATAASITFMQAILECTHTRVFFDATKSLMRLFHLSQSDRMNIRVVRMVRDVRAFVNSSMQKREADAREAATVWKRYHSAADQLLAVLPTNSVFQLRYEDLCCERGVWMARLFAFLGVQPADVPETLDASRHHILGNEMRLAGTIKVALNERWRTELGSKDQDVALRVAGELNDRFGYTQRPATVGAV